MNKTIQAGEAVIHIPLSECQRQPENVDFRKGKYNNSKAAHLYPPFFDIPCSAKNYKIAPALTPVPNYMCLVSHRQHTKALRVVSLLQVTHEDTKLGIV